jgi:hypothetical protein
MPLQQSALYSQLHQCVTQAAEGSSFVLFADRILRVELGDIIVSLLHRLRCPPCHQHRCPKSGEDRHASLLNLRLLSCLLFASFRGLPVQWLGRELEWMLANDGGAMACAGRR